MSRVLYQVGIRVTQGMKDQASKCDSTTTLKFIRDSKQGRGCTGALDSSSAAAFKTAARSDQPKQAEESIRTVMFLSCWGLN